MIIITTSTTITILLIVTINYDYHYCRPRIIRDLTLKCTRNNFKLLARILSGPFRCLYNVAQGGT